MFRPDDQSTPFRSVAVDFGDHLAQRGRSPETIYRYGVTLREFEHLIQDEESSGRCTLDTTTFADYVRQLSNRNLAAPTVAMRLARLNTFLQWAGDREDTTVAPQANFALRELRGRVLAGGLDDTSSWREGMFELIAPNEPLAVMTRGDAVELGDDGANREESIQGSPGPNAEPDGGEPQPDSPADVVRYLNARAPDRAAPGDPVAVMVNITVDRKAGASEGLLRTTVPPEGLDVTLKVLQHGFKVVGEETQTVHVPRRGDSPWSTFTLEAVVEGLHDIQVVALNAGTHLGSVALRIAVARDAGVAKTVERSDAVEERARRPGEVTLFVSVDTAANGKLLRYHLVDDSRFPNEPIDWLVDDPTRDVEQLIGTLGSLANDRSSLTPANRSRQIEAEGRRLWQRFVPQQLQDQFWSVAGRMTQLTILSEEDPVPWELLFPTRGKDSNGFLVEWCEVVRWQTGKGQRPPVSRLSVGKPAFVLPNDAPPAAASEIEALKLLDPRLAKPHMLRTAEEVLEAIEAVDFDLLHFATHNSVDDGGAAVQIGGESLRTVFLQAAEDGRTLAERSPLVFMNACRSANETPIFSEISGWAQSFLGAGAGAFLGSLWLVRDAAAKDFAEVFYRSLLEGATLGASLKTARTETKSGQGDPTWLAYTAYGDPAAIIH